MSTSNYGFDHLIHKESGLDSSFVTEEKSNCSKALFRVKGIWTSFGKYVFDYVCVCVYIDIHT